jgi:hypothetical protein
VVVQEGEEEGLALDVGIGRVGQAWAVQGVGLPEIAEVAALETAIDGLRLEQAGAGDATRGQVAAQGTWGQFSLGDGCSLVPLKDVDQGTGGAGG